MIFTLDCFFNRNNSFSVFYFGVLGILFARVLQASISGQKEYLADASSVQYTRNL
ncbi:hypothetical protein ACLB3J_000441 [Campylobacter jejuni]|nr:hypothetical protein [Campylobacter jejuni]HED7840838.1 hypothetical protein [Campylobacter jejuni]